MRKWMRDRLKRRKKEPEKPGVEAAPAPLQPSFYDSTPPLEPPAQTSTHEEHADAEPSSEPRVEAANHEGGGQATAGGTAGAAKKRRRSRGGRGRRRTGRPARIQTAQTTGDAQGGEVAQASAKANTVDQPAPVGDQQPAIPAAPAVARPPKGTVVLAIGLPGSGKSAWFKRHNITPLSSDVLRAMLFDDPTEQRFQDLIFSNLRSMLKARLIAKRPMNYVDATNLTPHDRHGWIKMAKDFGYEVQAVFFDVPVEVCMERNRKRERVVPDDVMRRMAGKLKTPTFEEGFAKITVVRVKQKDAV
jgi:predicted kinase